MAQENFSNTNGNNKKKKVVLAILIPLLVIILAAGAVAAVFLTKKEKASVTDIIVTTKIDNLVYEESFRKDAISVRIVYDDNTTKDITMEQVTISPADEAKLSVVGRHDITLTYEGFSKQFTFIIVPADLQGLTFESKVVPFNDDYYTFSVAGLVEGCTVKYYINDSQEPVNEVKIKDEGVYEVRAVVSKPNYNDVKLNATFEIVNYSISGITDFEYDAQTLTFSKKDIRNSVTELNFDELIQANPGVEWELYADKELSQQIAHTYVFQKEGLQEIYLKVFTAQRSTSIVYTISMYKLRMLTYTFVFNGETVNSGKVEETFTIEDPHFSREGYIIKGWLVNGKTVSFPYQALSNVIFTADYQFVDYTITYSGLEGVEEGFRNPETYRINTETFMLKNPTRKGYKFLGWKEDGVDSEPVLEKYIQKGSTGNKNIEAVWEKLTYTITYNNSPEAGEDEIITNENVTEYDVDTETFTLSYPERKGYTFIGWTGTGIAGTQKDVTIQQGSTGNLQLTANWQLTEYTITYENNIPEHDYDMVTNNNPKTYTILSDTITLSDPQRLGYTFLGWVVKDSGLEPEKNLTIEKGSIGEITFVAYWEEITYTISYKHTPVEEEGFDEISNPNAELYITYTINTETFALQQPTRKGYTFEGWSGTGVSGMQKEVTITQGSIGNKTFTANWKLTEYSITYVHEPVQGAYEDITNGNVVSYNFITETITLLDPTRKGYTFLGWTEQGTEEEPTKGLQISRGSVGEKTFVAHWEVITYNITYQHTPEEQDFDEIVNSNKVTYTIQDGAFSLTAPTRKGYTFLGWEGDGVEGTQTEVTIAEGTIGDLNFTAKWQEDTYTITYKNTSVLFPDDIVNTNKTQYTFTTETFTLQEPTCKGYTFLGWTGTGLEEMTKTVTIEKGSAGNVEYTANWQINQYTYTFKDALGGTFKTGTINYRDAIEAPETAPIKNSTETVSYIFTGWDQEIPEYIESNITFTPQYREESFTQGLLFEPNGENFVVSIGSAVETDITIPSQYNGKPVEVIKEEGFMGSNITSITIPSSVTTMGNSAFKGCESLTTVNGMEGLYMLPTEAFANCAQLHQITLGNNLMVIGDYAFAGCVGLEALHIPENVIAIDLHALEGLTAMKSFTVAAENKNYTAYEGNLYSKDMSVLIKYAMGKDVATFVLPGLTIEIAENAFDGAIEAGELAEPMLQNIILHENVLYIHDTSLPKTCHVFSYASEKPSTWSENSLAGREISWNGEWEMSGDVPSVITASAFKTGVYTNWMSYISDETRILSTVMPGAHDAGTVGMGDFYRTQNSGFYDMLNAGTRYFDMRVKEDNGLRFIHGNTNSTGQTGMLFQDGLNDIKKFIEENPSEVLILDFQHTWDSSEDAVIAMLTEVLGSEHMLKKSQAASLENVTMGQLRAWGINYIVTYRTESKCANKDYLYFREANLYSPYVGSAHQGGNDSLLSQMETYIKDYNSPEKIFILQSQRTGGISNLNIQDLESEFRAAGNAFNRNLSKAENKEKLDKINVIMRDFIADDVGAETAQQTIQSIIFLNIFKGNIKKDKLTEFKIRLNYNEIIAKI